MRYPQVRLPLLLVAVLAAGPAASAQEAGPKPASTSRFGTATVLHDLVYAQLEGDRDLRLDLYQPKVEKPAPVVLFIHGGSWRRGSKRSARRDLTQVLNQNGYAVAAVEYRLSGEAKFPAQIHDVKRAVRFLKRQAEPLRIDASRIASWGISAGGHLAALLAVTDADDGLEPPDDGLGPVSTRVRAAASWVGPMDMRVRDGVSINRRAERILQSFIGKSPKEAPELYDLASPIHFVSPDDPPMFLVQGLDDPLVPYRQAEVMRDSLTKAKVAQRTLLVENMAHGMQTPFAAPMQPSDEEINKSLLQFLGEHLRGEVLR